MLTIDNIDIFNDNRKKLVATVNRREGVYNRTGEQGATFCVKEEQRSE